MSMIDSTGNHPVPPSARRQPASLLLLLCLALGSAVILLGASTTGSTPPPSTGSGGHAYANLATAQALEALWTPTPTPLPATPTPTSTPTGPVFGVYLQPEGVPPDRQLDIDAIQRYLGNQRFIVVTTAADLVATVDATQPPSIWFHHDALGSIPTDWINAYRRNSTVIVGINMSVADFKSVLPVAVDWSTADFNPPGHFTFVTYAEALNVPFINGLGTPSTYGGRSMSNDVFNVHAPAYVLGNVENSIVQHQLRLNTPR